jgi:hypothetical protein
VPAANVLHTAFSSVECFVGGMRITKPHFMYGYQAYIEDTFLTRASAKNSLLTNQAYFPDLEGKFQNYGAKDEIDKNPGAAERFQLTTLSKWLQLSGQLKV